MMELTMVMMMIDLTDKKYNVIDYWSELMQRTD